MQTRKTPLVLVAILALLLVNLTVTGEVTVEPVGIPEVIEAGEMIETEIVLTNYGNQDVNFEVDIEDIDLEEDEEQAGPRRDRRGGPQDGDDYDYEWRDNLENDGPEYEWIDIRDWDETREFRLGDDQNTGAVNLNWDFPFYEESFDRIYCDSDGWSSFVNSSQSINTAYPFPSRDQNWYYTLAIANGDWDGTRNGAGPMYTWTDEEEIMIITYYQWDARDNGSHADYQIILEESGMITYQYGDRFGEGNRFATACHVGVNGADGFGFQMVERNAGGGYLEEGRTIGFGPAGAWLSWVVLTP